MTYDERTTMTLSLLPFLCCVLCCISIRYTHLKREKTIQPNRHPDVCLLPIWCLLVPYSPYLCSRIAFICPFCFSKFHLPSSLVVSCLYGLFDNYHHLVMFVKIIFRGLFALHIWWNSLSNDLWNRYDVISFGSFFFHLCNKCLVYF